jgi:hypothetical protein
LDPDPTPPPSTAPTKSIITFYFVQLRIAKINRPVTQSKWFTDFFEEIEYKEYNEEKRRMLKLRIQEPIKSSQWNDENEWCCIHNIMEN